VRPSLLILAVALAGLAAPRQEARAQAMPAAPTGGTQVTPATDVQLHRPPAEGPAEGCGDKANEGFLDRFIDTYKEHLAFPGTEPAPTTVNERGVAVPLTSPPYPSATWNMGGTPVIGAENMYYGAFMDTLYCGPHGQAIKDSRFTVYGWVEPSLNFSTSHSKFSGSTGFGGNFPAAYDYQPNTIMLDQVALYFERTPDTVQTDHVDWGFRFANLYGTDYKYTFAQGTNSDAFLLHHHQYGYDPVMMYGDIYIPQVAQGMNIRFGRYISIPDIEAQLAPNNYTFTHSLLYSYDPYTQYGIVGTIKLNRNWTLQLEFSEGNDVSPWSRSRTKPTPAVCVSWTSDDGNDNIYPCINGINSQKYAYNNIQHLVATWYHKFSPRWHMASEAWYMWEKGVPTNRADTTATDIPTLINNANGAHCAPNQASCRADEFAVLNYLAYQIGPLDAIELRTEVFDDRQGQRTGFPTVYGEIGIGWQHWLGDAITIRPEIRFERAFQAEAYNNPTGSLAPGSGSKDQFQFATDMVVHF
jgi:Putative beta-barrel porin-2, OmpL-like. bbp2